MKLKQAVNSEVKLQRDLDIAVQGHSSADIHELKLRLSGVEKERDQLKHATENLEERIKLLLLRRDDAVVDDNSGGGDRSSGGGMHITISEVHVLQITIRETEAELVKVRRVLAHSARQRQPRAAVTLLRSAGPEAPGHLSGCGARCARLRGRPPSSAREDGETPAGQDLPAGGPEPEAQGGDREAQGAAQA